MNVYDFDKTIYKKDSSIELYKYVCLQKPQIFFRCITTQLCAIIRYKMHLITKEEMKETYFCFLQYIDAANTVKEFVNREFSNINKWYLSQQQNDDIIISASPDFLVRSFAERLSVPHVIASEVDIKTGQFYSKNCHDKEKVCRFQKEFPEANIDSFYSDSKSDIYMARLAKSAFLVKGTKITKWIIN